MNFRHAQRQDAYAVIFAGNEELAELFVDFCDQASWPFELLREPSAIGNLKDPSIWRRARRPVFTKVSFVHYSERFCLGKENFKPARSAKLGNLDSERSKSRFDGQHFSLECAAAGLCDCVGTNLVHEA